MASKQYFVDLDLNKQSLLNVKINPLTTVARTALTLGAGDEGMTVYDIDFDKLFFFNGSAWITYPDAVASVMTYQGAHTDLVNAPATTTVGSTYVFTGASGTLTWAGVTFAPSGVVSSGDMIVFRDATNVDIVQANDVTATTAVSGNITLATDGEVLTGTDSAKAVVSSSLTNYVTTKQLARTYFIAGVSLVANTPLTITHNLALSNKNAFVCRVSSGDSDITCDIDAVTINTLTLTSNVALSADVTVIGF